MLATHEEQLEVLERTAQALEYIQGHLERTADSLESIEGSLECIANAHEEKSNG